MIRRNVTYGCSGLIGLCCLILLGWCIPVYATQQEAVPLLETTGFELLGTKNGSLAFSVKADEMCQYENGDITLTGGIEIVLLGNNPGNEEGLTQIQADRLSYDKSQGLCIIAGNVLVNKPKKQLSITAAQLSYDMKQEVLFTESPIVITDKENVLKGSGLRATKDLTQYTVTAPSGTVDIKQEAVLGG